MQDVVVDVDANLVLKEFEERPVREFEDISALDEQFLHELGFNGAERHLVSVSRNKSRTVEKLVEGYDVQVTGVPPE